MFRRTIHRGIAALSLVTFLALAGAQPAAAAPGAGFLDRLAGVWSAVVGGESDSLWNRLTIWKEAKPAAKSPRATAKRGFGIDPNGERLESDTENPTPTMGGPNGS
jgi:hypothetical protein